MTHLFDGPCPNCDEVLARIRTRANVDALLAERFGPATPPPPNRNLELETNRDELARRLAVLADAVPVTEDEPHDI